MGIAIATEKEHASTVCGTVLYMEPEVFNYQKYDAKVDILALGLLLMN